MNNGSLRQHIEGKAHKLNFDTGERIIEPGIPNDILALIKLQDQEQKAKPTTIDFDKLKSQLEFILGDDTEAVKDLLASHAFDDKIKYDLQNRLEINKKMKHMKNKFKLKVLTSKRD